MLFKVPAPVLVLLAIVLIGAAGTGLIVRQQHVAALEAKAARAADMRAAAEERRRDEAAKAAREERERKEQEVRRRSDAVTAYVNNVRMPVLELLGNQALSANAMKGVADGSLELWEAANEMQRIREVIVAQQQRLATMTPDDPKLAPMHARLSNSFAGQAQMYGVLAQALPTGDETLYGQVEGHATKSRSDFRSWYRQLKKVAANRDVEITAFVAVVENRRAETGKAVDAAQSSADRYDERAAESANRSAGAASSAGEVAVPAIASNCDFHKWMMRSTEIALSAATSGNNSGRTTAFDYQMLEQAENDRTFAMAEAKKAGCA